MAQGASNARVSAVNPRQPFRAEFEHSENAAHEAELRRLKDALYSIADIQQICRRYGVSARVFESGTGRIVGDVERDGSQAAGWGSR
ncbi:MAG: hypothetical protein RL685_7697 [Pseudomonadota bacterium]|jgi:hypothetical protein